MSHNNHVRFLGLILFVISGVFLFAQEAQDGGDLFLSYPNGDLKVKGGFNPRYAGEFYVSLENTGPSPIEINNEVLLGVRIVGEDISLRQYLFYTKVKSIEPGAWYILIDSYVVNYEEYYVLELEGEEGEAEFVPELPSGKYSVQPFVLIDEKYEILGSSIENVYISENGGTSHLDFDPYDSLALDGGYYSDSTLFSLGFENKGNNVLYVESSPLGVLIKGNGLEIYHELYHTQSTFLRPEEFDLIDDNYVEKNGDVYTIFHSTNWDVQFLPELPAGDYSLQAYVDIDGHRILGSWIDTITIR
ncbi:MAG: hypothetical protein PQJ59_09925 [Spirochaetales bacterium]|nr:hypothetical protein [Spirochaetales bacterium]